MNCQSGIIGDLNEKWVKGQTRPYGNKELKTKKEKMRNEDEWKAKHGLTLKWDVKRPKVAFGSSFYEQTRF